MSLKLPRRLKDRKEHEETFVKLCDIVPSWQMNNACNKKPESIAIRFFDLVNYIFIFLYRYQTLYGQNSKLRCNPFAQHDG